MSTRCRQLLAFFVVLMVLPGTVYAGDAFLKLGLNIHSGGGGFTDRWFVSAGTDWGVADMAYLGLEFQGAYRSNTVVGAAVVDTVPANIFLNGKWKSSSRGVRPYAGLGLGMVSAYVKTEILGQTFTTYEKDAAFQLMAGVELHRKWILELLGQHVFRDNADFRWSIAGGFRW